MSRNTLTELSASAFLAGSLVRKVVYPLWLRRDHPATARYLREFEQSQWQSREEIQAQQIQKLSRLVNHAYQNCPFYTHRVQQAGIDPKRIQSAADLQSLPVLTKQDIQQNQADLTAGNFSSSTRVRNQTGGSTGSPLQFWVDRERLDSRLASTLRHNAWTGLQPGDWCAQLWGARLDQTVQPGFKSKLKNHLLYRTVELNTARIAEDDWTRFVAELRSKRPRFMVAYARSAVLFARYLRQHRITDIKFRSVITTAEVLLPEERSILEQVFSASVFNRYGCREVSVIASECEHHTGLHVNSEALLVEVLPGTSGAGKAGKVLVTDLLNYSMPLIRYEIGDVAEWSEALCSCGRGLPTLKNVYGRTTDFLIMCDGRHVSGPALTLVVADMSDVRQVQFVQDQLGKVRLRVVPGHGYSDDTANQLRQRLSNYLDPQTELQIENVSEIPPEASGKYRFVVNTMRSASLAETENVTS